VNFRVLSRTKAMSIGKKFYLLALKAFDTAMT